MNATEALRDVTLEEAARILHRRPSTLKKHWHEIPTAYVEGKRYVVSLGGLEAWQLARGKQAAK